MGQRIELPEGFRERILREAGADGAALLEALAATGPVTGVRLNPRKPADTAELLRGAGAVPWCEGAFTLPGRPEFTLDPLFHAGAYYVQDPSSAVHYTIVKRLTEDGRPVRVLDLCAAPGGKATAALSALPEGSLLVANEVMPQRAAALAENTAKWGHPAVAVTSAQAGRFALLGPLFDLIILDAPCSGEGMMRKEPVAVSQWSERLVEGCAALQREIAADAIRALRPGGVLLYSTCTFSRQENEEMVRHFVEEYGMESIGLGLERYGVPRGWSDEYCYRFMPHLTRGEGLFVAALRLPGDAPSAPLPKLGKRGKTPASGGLPQWLAGQERYTPIEAGGGISMLAPGLAAAVERLRGAAIRILRAGVPLGTPKGRDFVPAPELALSTALRPDAFPDMPLCREEALSYLRRDAVTLPPAAPRGFVTASYGGLRLGFLKNIGNRANNLFPDRWKIKFK